MIELTGKCPKCDGGFGPDGLCPVCGISCSHKFLGNPSCSKCGWISPTIGAMASERAFEEMAEKARM